MRRTVLIVDDSYACGDTLAIALADLPDVDVRMVESSLEALKLIETIPLAAVVTDLHMPRVDGFELIERIRAHFQMLEDRPMAGSRRHLLVFQPQRSSSTSRR